MLLKSIKLLFLAIFISSIFSCAKDGLSSEVDTRLQPYFDSFVEEAALRDIAVDLTENRIIARVTDIVGNSVAGSCANSQSDNSYISIDEAYWNAVDNLAREMVVFHELGHCILKRAHLESRDENGDCISLMESGLGNCNLNYTLETRDKMLDELFSG